MCSSKRVRWSLLGLVGLVLFAAAPALAVEHGDAILAPVFDEPDASGEAALKDAGDGVIEFHVKCTGLTPDKVYSFNAPADAAGGTGHLGVADEHGKLSFKGHIFLVGFTPVHAFVHRMDIVGYTVSYQTVLFGDIVWK